MNHQSFKSFHETPVELALAFIFFMLCVIVAAAFGVAF